MTKHIWSVVALSALAFTTAPAQMKIGHFNSTSVIKLMPEAQDAQRQLDQLVADWQKTINQMQDEWKKKFAKSAIKTVL